MTLNLSETFSRNGFICAQSFLSKELIGEALQEFRSIHIDPKYGESPVEEEDLIRNYPIARQLQAKAQALGQRVLDLPSLPLIIQNQAVLRKASVPASEGYHLDGRRLLKERHASDWNAMPLMEMIVGIPLIDIPRVNCGNLAFLPEAHKLMAKSIYEEWERLVEIKDPWGAFRELDYIANALNRENESFAITYCGDVYMIHGLMPHRVLRNDGPVRPVWYFRMGVPRVQGREAFNWRE